MSNFLSRRFFLTALTSTVATPLFANAPERSLRPHLRPESLGKQPVKTVEELIEAANLNGDVAFSVVEIGTGKVLEQHGITTGLPPASVSKAVTALYALDALGPNHRFKTRVVATKPIENGVLRGDLILVGGADPTLSTDHLGELVQTLATAGLKRVEGRFLVYGGALPFAETIDPEQPPHVGYSPAISGICLNFNRVYFDWKKTVDGYDTAMEARSAKHRPPVHVARVSLTDNKTPIFAYSAKNGKDNWTVARHALNKAGGRWLPMRQPEIYAGEVLRWHARARGITLPSPQKTTSFPRGETLATHSSGPLTDVLRDMLKYSTNVTAEMVGLSATLARGTYAASLRASGQYMSEWAAERLGMAQAKFMDHSGLSDRSRMDAGELALALAAFQRKEILHPILKPITLKHENGSPNKDHPINVYAKTGTLNFVSGLAGYLESSQGEEMAFAIFAADTDTRSKLTRDQRERPRGAKSWNSRAKKLQQKLIERWGLVYAS